MLISTKVSFDLLKLSHPAVINAMQGDRNTRSIEAKLYSDGYPWTDTSGLTAAVAFKKPDGTSGIYDRLPNGSSAVTVSKDTITAILAPQMLTAPGKVNAAILLSDASQQNQISTFPFHVHVEANPAAEAAASDDYYNYTSWEELSNAADAWFAEQDKKIAETIEGIRRVSAPSIVEPVRGEIITVSDASDLPLAGLKVFGKTEQNGIPTPEAPVPLESVGDSVNVTVTGKNMFPKAVAGELSNNGITFTSYGDGSYRVKGTATSDVTLHYDLEDVVVLKEGMYLHCMNSASADISFLYWYDDFTSSYWALNPVNRISALSKNFGKTITRIGINMKSGSTVDVTFSPMFVFSGTPMDFVPYQSIQTLPISTPNGLPGIPVTSGGNYTDSTGQQWVCDYVDFEKGVYVQRIGTLKVNGSEVWGPGVNSGIFYTACNDAKRFRDNQSIRLLSTHFYDPCKNWEKLNPGEVSLYNNGNINQYPGLNWIYVNIDASVTTKEQVKAFFAENPCEFCYELATPIEPALSEEQLAAFAALRSNYPNTTVYNDKNAGMEVKYVADTKLYIDQKFNELAAALVSKV